MKYSFSILALALGASAASNCTCTFNLSASGGQTGIVGQLGDGQNRIGGNNTEATYCINNGQITDSKGRGCILTPPTTQFQCDVGATPTGGFSLASNGMLTYMGSTTFYACPASTIMYNIYTTPVQGQTKCVKIELTASGCYSAVSSSMKPVTSSMKPMSSSMKPVSTSTKTASTTVKPVSSSIKPVSSSSKPAPAPQTVMTSNTAKPSASVQVCPVVCPAPQTVTVTSVITMPAPKQSSAPAPVMSSAPAPKVSSAPAPKMSSAPAPKMSSAPAPVVSSTPAPKMSSAPAPVMSSGTAPAPIKSTGTAPAPIKSTGTAPAPSSTCPANLSGSYQYPHLIIPVSSSSPNKAYGTSYNGTITPDTSSIFNFDIPTSYTGTCSLIFLLPMQKDLQTSSFSLYGNGMLDFKMLNSIASQSTTYNNQGSVKTDFGKQTIKPGSATTITTFPCPAGTTVSYEISSVNGTSLRYFQDYNPCPIGLYITTS